MTQKSYLDEVREASSGGVLIRGDVCTGDPVTKPLPQEDHGDSADTGEPDKRTDRKPS